jgi:hypothetical protein
MLDLSEKNEFPDAKQRTAVCYSQFKKSENEASVVVGGAWDDSDIYYFFKKD